MRERNRLDEEAHLAEQAKRSVSERLQREIALSNLALALRRSVRPKSPPAPTKLEEKAMLRFLHALPRRSWKPRR